MTRGASRLILLALLGTPIYTLGMFPLEPKQQEPALSNGTVALADKIRRQLMANNYDYMESETEEPFPARRPAGPASTALPRDPPSVSPPTAAPPPAGAAALHPRINEIFLPRAASLSEPDPPAGAGVLENDLLYYVDDDRLKQTQREVLEDDEGFKQIERAFGDENMGYEATSITPKVSYKVLKVSAEGGGRRAGVGGYRFVQEERDGGVALINLGDQPFPQFRLPRARRHYLAGRGARASEPELELAHNTDISAELRPPGPPPRGGWQLK